MICMIFFLILLVVFTQAYFNLLNDRWQRASGE